MRERSHALRRESSRARLDMTVEPHEGGHHYADSDRHHAKAERSSASGGQLVVRCINDSVAKGRGHAQLCQPISTRKPFLRRHVSFPLTAHSGPPLAAGRLTNRPQLWRSCEIGILVHYEPRSKMHLEKQVNDVSLLYYR